MIIIKGFRNFERNGQNLKFLWCSLILYNNILSHENKKALSQFYYGKYF